MSKIALPIAELKPALAGLGKVISRRCTLPVLGHVKVERTKDGWIALTGTDLDRTVTVRLEQPSEGKAGAMLVPFEELQKIAKPCSKEDILLLEAEDNTGGENNRPSVTIHYPIGQQSAQTRVESLPVLEFPETPRVKGEPMALPDSLRTSIHEAMECSSDDETRYILNSAFIDVSQAKCHHVVGTNGRILYSSNSFSLPMKESVIIPRHPFLGWKEFNHDGEWQLRVDPKDDDKDPPPFQITSRRWRYISKQIEGNYPNWRQVVPDSASFETRFEFPADSLDSLIQTIQRMPCDSSVNHAIGLEFNGRTLRLIGRTPGAEDWTKVEIPIAKPKGKPVTIQINREYLATALQFGLNTVEIVDRMSPMRLTNGGRQFIIMPVRASVGDPGRASSTATAASTPTSPVPEPEQVGEAAPKPMRPESKPEAKPAAPSPAASLERSNMVNQPANTTTTAPASARTAEEPAPASDIDSVLDTIEDLRESLTANLTDLKSVTGKLKQIKRDQKIAEREMQTFRQTLRGLQSVKL